VRSSPQAGCSAPLRPVGDRAAFRGAIVASGQRAFRENFDGLRRVEQRAVGSECTLMDVVRPRSHGSAVEHPRRVRWRDSATKRLNSLHNLFMLINIVDC